jgi:hypothetical protein
LTFTILTIIIGIITFILLARNHRLDFKKKKVLTENLIIEACVSKDEYETGGVTFPVNLLSLLFFKQIFMRKMKELHFYSIVIDDERVYHEKG